jgi:hypothetical protein
MLVAVIGEALAQIRWVWNRDGGCLTVGLSQLRKIYNNPKITIAGVLVNLCPVD